MRLGHHCGKTITSEITRHKSEMMTMSKNPFFSVIVPAFNSAEYIRKGLDSVKAQRFTDYELIVVCDNCVDNTAEIAREYTDKVITCNHFVDGPTRNHGLDLAIGQWVLFLDDDDWFLHEFVFEMLATVIREQIQEDDVDIIAFSFIWKGVGYASNTQQRIFPAVWNKAWKREFIGDERFPDAGYQDDYAFAVKMHPKARFVIYDQPLYYYNFMRPGCVSEKIRDGVIDISELPESLIEVAKGYKDALKCGGDSFR